MTELRTTSISGFAVQYTQRINAKVANFFAGDSDLSKCDATHILIAQNKCTPTSLLWLVLKHINCVKCHISEREICDMPGILRFNVRGFTFMFHCRYDVGGGVTLNQSSNETHNFAFIQALAIALDMFPAVDAAYTLNEIAVCGGGMNKDNYNKLYELAHSSEFFDPTEYVQGTERITQPPTYECTPGAKKRKAMPGYVYLVQSPTGAYKIGKAKDPSNRQKTFDVKLPFEVEFIALIQSDDMRKLEAELHAQFADKRVNGEWFNLAPEDVEYIKGLAQ